MSNKLADTQYQFVVAKHAIFAHFKPLEGHQKGQHVRNDRV